MLAMKNDGRIGKPKKEQKLLMCLRFTELENDFGTWNQVMLGLACHAVTHLSNLLRRFQLRLQVHAVLGNEVAAIYIDT